MLARSAVRCPAASCAAVPARLAQADSSSRDLDRVLDAIHDLRAARAPQAKISVRLQAPLATAPLAGGLAAAPPARAADDSLLVHVECTTLGSPELAALERAGLTAVFIVRALTLPPIADTASAGEATVLRSTPIYGANGLAIDKDDHLLIAGINPKAVLVMDTDTGKILGKYTGPLITGPDDVSIAKDGSIYYSDIFSGNVGRISPTGEVSLVANLGPWART